MSSLNPQALAELRRRNQNGLYTVAVALTGMAKELATRHNDNGTRRNSITQAKLDDGSVIWGIPVGAAPHAPHLEFGFKPHFVPSRYIGLWARRHGFDTKNLKGLYVGGPGSTLQSAPGGAIGVRVHGKKRTRGTWHTRGGQSKFLTQGKVGHPVLQPTAARIKEIPLATYKRGFDRG